MKELGALFYEHIHMNLTKIILISFTFICILALQANGQNAKIDSLKTLLQRHSNDDTAKVNLINTLAYELFTSDPQKAETYVRESWKMALLLNYHKGKATCQWITGLLSLRKDKKEALEYFQKALKIAEVIEDDAGMSNYLTAIGNVTKDLGNMNASNEAHKQALQIALKLKDKSLIIRSRINISRNMNSAGNYIEAVQQLQEVIKIARVIDDKRMLAGAYGNLALIHQIQSDFPTALEYYFSALQLNEKINNYSGIFVNLVNIAGIQSDQNDFNVALSTIQKALRLSIINKDTMRMSTCFTNIGNIYQRMKHPEALDYFQKAQTMAKGENVSQNINNLVNIGEIYTAREEFEKAVKNFDEALALAQKANIKKALCEVYVKVGALYFRQKKYSQAIDYTQKAFSIAENIAYIELQKDCDKQRSDIYAAIGNFKDAYISHTQYKLLDDSIFIKKNIRKTALIESSYKFAQEKQLYESEKSGHELKIRNQRQTILLLLIISLLVLSLSFATYWSSKLKKKVLRLEIEKINQELENNQRAMAVAKLKLVQNTERDAHHVKILEDIEKKTDSEDLKSIRSLINNYKSQVVNSNWEEFETLFAKINTSFLDKLNKLYPTLTSNERKLCVFLKLNLSNKDIAGITLQSEEALKKSRLRLRKKLELERSANLTAFIQCL